jgi:hypothetical protein
VWIFIETGFTAGDALVEIVGLRRVARAQAAAIDRAGVLALSRRVVARFAVTIRIFFAVLDVATIGG